jgi:putative Holliday junction resolvase
MTRRKRRKRACALDLGAVRVGVAVSDELGVLAHPRENLAARPVPAFLEAMKALVKEEGINHVVVGLPLDMKGGEGDSAKRARNLAQMIADETGCDVELWDERWSTKQAERALRASEVKGKKAKEQIDAAAACAILQAWLDAQSDRSDAS